MLGFVFAKNFDSPYKSQSITEFWRRWHISLSTWLREYLYIPLGGSRKGKVRTYVNLALTMLLGGLWHGAAWTFLVWGGIHGGMLAFERSRGKQSLYRAMPMAVRVGLTFLIVSVAWVFFRSRDLHAAAAYLAAMAGLGNAQAGAGLLESIMYKPYYLLTFFVAGMVVWTCPDAWNWTFRLSWRKALACAGFLALSLAALATQEYNPFIYFIF
jgi:alginate O-acetyltransferase complex protein AlgI